MTSPAADSLPAYADWKAPAGDGEVLIWPEPAELVRHTLENHQRLSRANEVHVQNVPLPELRRAARRSIGHEDDDRPLLATGHQAELYHAGVWVKDVLIDRAAAKVGGSAVHFAVDSDSPKHLHLRWPARSVPITDDPSLARAAWSARLAPPSAKHLSEIDQCARQDWPKFDFQPMLFEFLGALARPAQTLSAAITAAQHAVDESLGLQHRPVIESPMLRSVGFLAFAHHILARPGEFAESYNSALAEYRRRTGTRSPTRPMPDLFVNEHAIETPFWLDDLSAGTRTRPSVFRGSDGTWILDLVSGEQFAFRDGADAFDAAGRFGEFLERTNHRLAPRALTLTLFLRLLVVDQFVHGIGGGRYDQVADRIMASHFGLAPPSFAVTTATLFFPGAAERDRVCLPCLLQEGHRVRHAVLGERKRQLVEQILEHPRRSMERQALFLEMQQERRAAVAISPAVAGWEQKFRDSVARQQEEQVIFDRELFYAVQPRERLTMMIERYTEAFA